MNIMRYYVITSVIFCFLSIISLHSMQSRSIPSLIDKCCDILSQNEFIQQIDNAPIPDSIQEEIAGQYLTKKNILDKICQFINKEYVKNNYQSMQTIIPLPLPIHLVRLAYDKQNKILAYAGANNMVNVFDLKTHTFLDIINQSIASNKPLQFNADGTLFASINCNNTVSVWHSYDSINQHTLVGLDPSTKKVTFHPTKPNIFASADNYIVKIWDIEQNKCIRTLNATHDIVELAFHPTFNMLFTAHDDSTCVVWNLDNNTSQLIDNQNKKNTKISCITFNQANPSIVAISSDTQINIWNIKDDHTITAVKKLTLPGTTNCPPSLIFNQTGNLLCAPSPCDTSIKIWETNTWRLIGQLNHSNKDLVTSLIEIGPTKIAVAFEGSQGITIIDIAPLIDIYNDLKKGLTIQQVLLLEKIFSTKKIAPEEQSVFATLPTNIKLALQAYNQSTTISNNNNV